MNYLIRGARVVEPRRVVERDLLIEEGRIAEIRAVRSAAGAKVINAAGLVALPGFIDLHTHGGLGFDVTMGQFDPKRSGFAASPEAFAEAVPRIMNRFARCGTTRALLATLAAPEETLKFALAQLATYIEDPRNGKEGARLEGMLIEGTFIMKPERAGAQNPANFHAPDRAFFDRLNAAARGHIRYVNLVPEFGDPAIKFSRYLTARGILVGSGHSECAAEMVLRCAKAGNRVAIHLLNGSVGTSYKPFGGGNVVEAVLHSRDIYAELICDGFHIAPAYVMDAVHRKGFDRVILVTDAIFVAGARGIRSFNLAGKEGQVDPRGRYVHVKGGVQVLFGSVLNMATAFSNVVSWLTQDMEGVWAPRHRRMTLNDALVAAARCCATNAAEVSGMARPVGRGPAARNTGALAPGKCAVVTLGTLTGRPGNWTFKVKHTFVGGRKVF